MAGHGIKHKGSQQVKRRKFGGCFPIAWIAEISVDSEIQPRWNWAAVERLC
jgi:hypothetical protein